MGNENERSGAEELRLIYRNMDACRESCLDPYTAEQLLQIGKMHLASGWDFYPDQWTERQIREALAGKPPQWNDDETPRYDGDEVRGPTVREKLNEAARLIAKRMGWNVAEGLDFSRDENPRAQQFFGAASVAFEAFFGDAPDLNDLDVPFRSEP